LLACCPNATIDVVEHEVPRAAGLIARFIDRGHDIHIIQDDALHFLKETDDDSYDFIFLDDDHEFAHVRDEVHEAKRVLRPGGILAMHDVIGPFALMYCIPEGGIALDLPRLHSNGGLGIWQKPR
jgi:predicted O-methyltransferase YrrM